jgi:hypothetical protein
MRVPSYGLVAAVYGLALGASGACTSPHKLISARRTTCPVSKLEIRELVSEGDREDWIAVCGQRSFACSTREQGHRLIYACHALKTNAASTTAQDAGTLEDAASAIPLGASPAAAASDAAIATDSL